MQITSQLFPILHIGGQRYGCAAAGYQGAAADLGYPRLESDCLELRELRGECLELEQNFHHQPPTGSV